LSKFLLLASCDSLCGAPIVRIWRLHSALCAWRWFEYVGVHKILSVYWLVASWFVLRRCFNCHGHVGSNIGVVNLMEVTEADVDWLNVGRHLLDLAVQNHSRLPVCGQTWAWHLSHCHTVQTGLWVNVITLLYCTDRNVS